MSDTGEISKGCLTHYDNRHIQTRVDFLGLCAYDESLFSKEHGNKKEEPNQECMAKILRLFETLTDHARTGWQLKAVNAKDKGLAVPQEPKEYRFELTNGAIVSLILNTFGESTVRNSIDYLIHLGYIGRYQEKKNSIPVYWLNLRIIQPLLKEQAEKELSGFENTPSNIQGLKSYPKRPKSNPKPVNSNPSPSNSDPLGFESTDNNNSNIDKITEKDNKDSFGVFTPTLSETSLLDDFALTEEDQAEDDDDNAPTVKMPSIPKKPTPSSPAQVDPPAHVEAEPEQVASGQDEIESHSQQPEQQALMAAAPRQSARQAPKWCAEVMVAKAEELRGRAYSKITRPKEVRAAEKIFKRKEDITPEEFERVFVHRNDPWWHEHCGLLNVTDLAAVPKDKNDMRYMLELEKIEREQAREQESETKKAPSRKQQDRVISSFGTPGFDFAAEFYPSEAEKRMAYAAAQQSATANW